MPRIPIVDTILEKKGEILMLKRNFYPKNKLDLLGGYVESQESIEEAAQREAHEESGYKVKLIQKIGVYDYFDRGKKRVHVFVGKIVGGRLKKSEEGNPVWINLEKIKPQDLAFPQVHIGVLNDYLELRGSKQVFYS